ncbi:MAG: FliH/SctL family protein [Oceanipulchritudo sp.]
MPLSEQVSFSRPLKEAVLARHQPGGSGPQDPEVQVGEVESAQTLSEEQLRTETDRAYKEGFAAGKAEGEAFRDAAMETLRGEVARVLEGIRNESDGLVRELESVLPEFIIEGVGRILYTMEPDAEAVSQTVRDLVSGIDAEDRAMRLSINPEDAELLEEVDPVLHERFPGLTLVKEAGLSRGECFLESRFGISDARYAAKLNNLRKVLE